jgi:hypothetical protein
MMRNRNRLHTIKKRALSIPALIGAVLLTVSCGAMYSELAENLSKGIPGSEITSFSFPSVGAIGIISGTGIAVTVPFGTDVTGLVAAFTTTGKSVEVGLLAQSSGVTANDFTGPVTYTVTATDGFIRNYTVIVSVAPSTAKDITDFVILGVHGAITSNAIALTVPYGTDVTNLTPSIAITGASISPASGVSQDFSSPVTYTVTAADGSTKAYTVTVSVALNPAKDITDFVILGVHGTITGTAIALTVPYGTDVTNLTPTVTITGASVSPASGVPRNFSSPVTYTVTAADGSTQNYTVTVTVALNPAKDITDFVILGVHGTITGTAIALTVPYGTDVTNLTPTVTITGASVSPASGVPRDFSSPVTYTVTAADGSTQNYTVTVTVAPNPAKDITDFVILGFHGTITGTAIAVMVPHGTDVTNLTPTITITGASVSPASGVPQDFTNPVTYTVTAADGSTKNYTVTVSLGYTVTYNGNGYTAGAVPVDVNVYNNGNTVTVRGNTGDLRGPAIQDGITQRLVAWNTMANGGGTDYTPGTGTFTMGSGHVTLYARWTTDASVIGKIGPAGGFVFYDHGSYTGSPTWRYIEAGPYDLGPAPYYSENTTHFFADYTGFGDGLTNTNNILSGSSETGIAADICNNFVYNGFNDWYLPSGSGNYTIATNSSEMDRMYWVLFQNGIGNFTGGSYWSSTEYLWAGVDWDAVYYEYTGQHNSYISGRDAMGYVRPVRRF